MRRLLVPLALLSSALALACVAAPGAQKRAIKTPPKSPPAGPPQFLRDIAPILDRNSCSSAQCHGKFGGRGGFQVSLLTLSPEVDYAPLVTGDRGRRVNFAYPEQSLLLLKPAGVIPHGGGQRFAVGSPDYNMLLRWIKAGAPYSPTEPSPLKVVLSPSHLLMPKVGTHAQIRAIAIYPDGSKRDVTSNTVFSSSNDTVAQVSGLGLVRGARWGGGAILGRYLGHVAATFVTLPQTRKGAYPPIAAANLIDKLVFANLRGLNVVPSSKTNDLEFLRRVTLDTLGRLPTLDEITAFTADHASSKRGTLIERLLASPDYTDYRSLQLADLLRVNPQRLSNFASMGDRSATLFYQWIHQSVTQNIPWDQFVKALLTARGSTYYNGPANFFRIEQAPNDRMENIGQAFLGVRMSCARCHNHPFDRWTTDDYWNFAAFCEKVQLRPGSLRDEYLVTENNNGRLINRSVIGRNRGKVAPPTFLGEGAPAPKTPDMVDSLADWATSAGNPYFARATVNRLWSYYFGRGIINPVDDMRVTSPESVPGLIDALASELVHAHFDVKRIISLILNSNTYQLSSAPNNSNAADDQFFSRCQPRPMPAQVVLDMLDQATGTHEQFGSFPEQARAVQASLPVRNQFLDSFGESHREFLADIDPRLEPNLVQTLMMINSPYVENKVARGKTVPDALTVDDTNSALITDLYLRTFCRKPTARELKLATILLTAPDQSFQSHFNIAAVTAKKRTDEEPDFGPGGDKPGATTGQPDARTVKEQQKARAMDLLWALVTSREFFFNH